MSLLKFFKKQGSALSNDPSHDDLPCTSSSCCCCSSCCNSSSSNNTCSVVNIEVSQECESTIDAVTDFISPARVRILPPKPNQPKINFPKSIFGAQIRKKIKRLALGELTALPQTPFLVAGRGTPPPAPTPSH